MHVASAHVDESVVSTHEDAPVGSRSCRDVAHAFFKRERGRERVRGQRQKIPRHHAARRAPTPRIARIAPWAARALVVRAKQTARNGERCSQPVSLPFNKRWWDESRTTFAPRAGCRSSQSCRTDSLLQTCSQRSRRPTTPTLPRQGEPEAECAANQDSFQRCQAG